MTGSELKAIRKALGLSTVQMGRALGYIGKDNSVSVTVRRYEADMKPVPPTIARLVAMYGKHGVDASWL